MVAEEVGSSHKNALDYIHNGTAGDHSGKRDTIHEGEFKERLEAFEIYCYM